MMDKKEFYKEQTEKFRDFSRKFPDRDLFSFFNEWAESKDFSDEDKKGIFQEFVSLVKGRGILIPRAKAKFRNDPVAVRDIVRVILLALELADTKDSTEAERIQKNFLDMH